MKSLVTAGVMVVALCLAVASVEAATINFTPSDVVSTWQRAPNPRDYSNTNTWTNQGSYVNYYSNDGQALLYPTTVSGSFTFSSRVWGYGGDDDRYGLTFGWQDPYNNYRLSWEGRFNNDGWEELDGSRGLSLVRSVGGNSVSLLNSVIYWGRDVQYDLLVSRSGNTIGMKVVRVSDSAVLFDQSVTDTTYTDGKVGIWNASQPTNYANIALTTPDVPVPLPASVLLFAPALAGLAAVRRRFRK